MIDEKVVVDFRAVVLKNKRTNQHSFTVPSAVAYKLLPGRKYKIVVLEIEVSD